MKLVAVERYEISQLPTAALVGEARSAIAEHIYLKVVEKYMIDESVGIDIEENEEMKKHMC